MAEDIFSADPVEMDLAFNDVVGEGKKYNDPDALAKGYANIERHARTLEAENAAIRAKLDAAEAMKNHSNNSETPRQEPPAQGDNPTPAPNPAPNKDVDIRSQIQEKLKAQTEQTRALNNIEATTQRLVDTYGSGPAANEAVRKRAIELGVSIDYLRDAAATSPNAFYATMGITNTGGHDRSTPAPRSDVQFREGNRDQKNFEYFDRMRKDNPKAYFSKGTQAEMMNAAREQGADFYKR